VKIIDIPASVTFTRLAEIIDLPKSRVYIPKNKTNDTRYAWINDFVNEEEANKFVHQWSGSSILGETIKCVVAPTKNDETKTVHSSHESSMSAINTISKKHHELRSTRVYHQNPESVNPNPSPCSLMSSTTTKPFDTATNDGENKPKLHQFNRNENQPQQHHRPDQQTQRGEIKGKLLNTNNLS
jgi:hypothetical protein